MIDGDISEVVDKFPFVVGDYARKLAEKSHAFRLQVEPSIYELDDDGFSEDPFGENEESAPCFGLKQRFDDRVLIIASNACFMNCRHCTRKGLLKHAEVVRSD
jgi:lysine 2,3-aminomutase